MCWLGWFPLRVKNYGPVTSLWEAVVGSALFTVLVSMERSMVVAREGERRGGWLQSALSGDGR